MAGGITGFASKAALNYMTGKSLNVGTAPQTMQLALLTAAPPANPTIQQLNEVASTGYVRQNVTWSPATLNATPGQPSQIANSGNVLYGPFTDVNGLAYPVTHCALIGNVVPDSVANLFDVNTSGIETDASAWTSFLNGTIARSTAQKQAGAASLAVTIPAIGDSQVGNAAYFTVSPYTTYTAAAWVFSTVAGVQAKVDIPYYDGSNVQVAYNSTALTTLAANTWTQVTISGMAPATAVTAKTILRTTATAAGQVVYWDAMSLAPSLRQEIIMTWQFDAIGQAAQNESLQVSAGALTMSLG
jgi:hypothetical protein